MGRENKIAYRFTPPEANGFYRHTDQDTGVPEWWSAFSQEFTFDYQQDKGDFKNAVLDCPGHSANFPMTKLYDQNY